MEISACRFSGLVVTLSLLAPLPPAFAQQHPLQIESFSVGPDQTLTYPDSSSDAKSQLAGLADDHTTFFPPASGAPYLVFAGALAGLQSGIWGTVVLQSPQLMKTTDLTIFDFAPGYNFPVLTSPNRFTHCNPPGDNTEFDENYAAPGSVLQDPTLPAGNLIMIYHAENHCPDNGTTVNFNKLFYATVGLTRSSDNGKTWPQPEGGALGGPRRYAVIQSSAPPPTGPHKALGDASPSAIVYKSVDGNYYLYVAYVYFSGSGQESVRAARAKLGPGAIGEQANPPLTFLKWYEPPPPLLRPASFIQPGISGLDSDIMPSTGSCSAKQDNPDISYNDDLGLYLMISVCYSETAGDQVGGWYYSTATSLDLEDWTTPQLIQNSQYPNEPCAIFGGLITGGFDGTHPSTLSPGAASGHTKLTGLIFFSHNACGLANRRFLSRTFTIVAEPSHP